LSPSTARLKFDTFYVWPDDLCPFFTDDYYNWHIIMCKYNELTIMLK